MHDTDKDKQLEYSVKHIIEYYKIAKKKSQRRRDLVEI